MLDLAASLLTSGATAVGFGGYVGSSRIDISTLITQEADSPVVVIKGILFNSVRQSSKSQGES